MVNEVEYRKYVTDKVNNLGVTPEMGSGYPEDKIWFGG